MQSLRTSVLSYVRVRVDAGGFIARDLNAVNRLGQSFRMCVTSADTNHDEVMGRVLRLVKKFDAIDAGKVTETADFQKDLSLDSLDRVELVMAFEQEFSIEIPDQEADKLKCCADVAKYIVAGTGKKAAANDS